MFNFFPLFQWKPKKKAFYVPLSLSFWENWGKQGIYFSDLKVLRFTKIGIKTCLIKTPAKLNSIGSTPDANVEKLSTLKLKKT